MRNSIWPFYFLLFLVLAVVILRPERTRIREALSNCGEKVRLYFSDNPQTKKWLIIGFIVVVILLVYVVPNNIWTCDRCDKTWFGTAYHGSDYSSTLCENCAWKYWSPLPIENYKK